MTNATVQSLTETVSRPLVKTSDCRNQPTTMELHEPPSMRERTEASNNEHARRHRTKNERHVCTQPRLATTTRIPTRRCSPRRRRRTHPSNRTHTRARPCTCRWTSWRSWSRGRAVVPGGVVPVPGGGQQRPQQPQQPLRYGYYGIPDQPPADQTRNELREVRMPDGNTYPSRWETATDTGTVGRWVQNGPFWNTAQGQQAIAARAQPQIGIAGAGRGQAQRLLVAGPYVGQPQAIPNNPLRLGQNQTVRVRGRSYVSQWVPAGWGGRQTTQGHWELVRSYMTRFSGRGRGTGRQTRLGFGPARSMHLSS